jgi:pyruvate kinase
MDVARLNLSHGDVRRPRGDVPDVRAASDEVGRAVGILVDLQGPKIRTTRFSGRPGRPDRRRTFTITTREVDGDPVQRSARRTRAWPVTSTPATPLLIDDGKVALEVATEVTRPMSSARSSRAARSPTTRASTCPASP